MINIFTLCSPSLASNSSGSKWDLVGQDLSELISSKLLFLKVLQNIVFIVFVVVVVVVVVFLVVIGVAVAVVVAVVVVVDTLF